MNRRTRQRGVGLVEIMVALAIALFLLMGMETIFLTTRSTYGAQQGLSNLQDNERLAMLMLTNVIQTAGYFPDPDSKTAAQSFPVVAPYGTGGQAIAGTEGGFDSISVRYVAAPNEDIQNCIGQKNSGAANVIFDNTFHVNPATNTLDCSVDGGLTWQSLVSQVADMQVLYGLDTTNAGSVTRYVDASYPGLSGGNWAKVRSVRITLSFVNPLAGQPGQTSPIPFTVVVPVMNGLKKP